MSGIERRVMPLAEIRVKPGDDGAPTRTLTGYAAVFDKLSVEMWGFYEEIAPGAFADSIAAGDDVRALFNHDPNIVLGRSTAGTLRLAEDDIGLAVEIDLPDTQQARDLVASVSRGDVSQMSFAFATVDEKWRIDSQERYVRRLLQVKLYDVAPVTYPAYPDTVVGLRGAPTIFGEIPAIPAALTQARDAAAAEVEPQARFALLRRRLDLEQV